METSTVLLTSKHEPPWMHGEPYTNAENAYVCVTRCFGFSLLEMMMVITLILIMATFAMPIYRTIVTHVREAKLREDLFTLRSQLDRFTHDNERGPSSLDELVEKGYMGAIPSDPFTGSNETWQVETETTSLSVDGSAPLGIVEVHSGSNDDSLDGTPYASW